MSNPNPNQSGLTNFQPQGELIEPLAAKPINTKHYRAVDAVLRGRKDRQALIRRYVMEGLLRDGLIEH